MKRPSLSPCAGSTLRCEQPGSHSPGASPSCMPPIERMEKYGLCQPSYVCLFVCFGGKYDPQVITIGGASPCYKQSNMTYCFGSQVIEYSGADTDVHSRDDLH